MSDVVSLVPRLPIRSALDFISVQPDTEGRVIVTTTNGREDIVLEFTADEVAILAGRLADALEIAEEMAR